MGATGPGRGGEGRAGPRGAGIQGSQCSRYLGEGWYGKKVRVPSRPGAPPARPRGDPPLVPVTALGRYGLSPGRGPEGGLPGGAHSSTLPRDAPPLGRTRGWGAMGGPGGRRGWRPGPGPGQGGYMVVRVTELGPSPPARSGANPPPLGRTPWTLGPLVLGAGPGGQVAVLVAPGRGGAGTPRGRVRGQTPHGPPRVLAGWLFTPGGRPGGAVRPRVHPRPPCPHLGPPWAGCQPPRALPDPDRTTPGAVGPGHGQGGGRPPGATRDSTDGPLPPGPLPGPQGHPVPGPLPGCLPALGGGRGGVPVGGSPGGPGTCPLPPAHAPGPEGWLPSGRSRVVPGGLGAGPGGARE